MGFVLCTIVLASAAFYHVARGQLSLPVDCSGGRYQDQVFLNSYTGIHLCKGNRLSQEGCFFPNATAKHCFDLSTVMRTFSEKDKIRNSYYDPSTGYNCGGIVKDFYLIFVLGREGLFQDCAQYLHGEGLKYESFSGHPLCNINGRQVYNFQDGGWEKCNETGVFELQSCIGDRPGPQCALKTDLDDLISEIPDTDFYLDSVPYCKRLKEKETGFLNSTFPACTFDDPIKIEKTTKPVITSTVPVTSTTVIQSTSTAKTSTEVPKPKPTSKMTTRKEPPTPIQTTTKKPIEVPTTNTITTTKKQEDPHITTTEPEETTTPEPEPTCQNGLRFNVWYDNEEPTHCKLFKEDGEEFFANINHLYKQIFKANLKDSDWDYPKMNIIYWKFAYMGKEAMHWVHRWDWFSLRIYDLLWQFAYDETPISNEIPVGPRTFCDFFQNFLPIKMDFIYGQAADNRLDEDDCEPKNYKSVDYPTMKYNVWWELYDNGAYPTKCYINYVSGNKKCISFKKAENILSQFNAKTDLIRTDGNKMWATATRLSLFKGNLNAYKRPDTKYRFDTMMSNNIHITHIIKEYNEMLTKGIDQDKESSYPFIIDSTEPLRLGVTSFCTIFSELVPLHFDQWFIDLYFQDCHETVNESDFPETESESGESEEEDNGDNTS